MTSQVATVALVAVLFAVWLGGAASAWHVFRRAQSKARVLLYGAGTGTIGAVLGAVSGHPDGDLLFLLSIASGAVLCFAGLVMLVSANTRPVGRVALAAVGIAGTAFTVAGLVASRVAG